LKQIGASAERTFEALFNADIAKSVLEHFWARLPLTYNRIGYDLRICLRHWRIPARASIITRDHSK
jgi:hypothetical protein